MLITFTCILLFKNGGHPQQGQKPTPAKSMQKQNRNEKSNKRQIGKQKIQIQDEKTTTHGMILEKEELCFSFASG